MNVKLTAVAAAAVAAAALATSGCGGARPAAAEVPKPHGSIQGGDAGAAVDPHATGPAADVAGARHGGTVTVLERRGPQTLDPSEEYTTDGSEIMRLTTRTLTAYQHRGSAYVLVPDLATDLGEVSADGLTWTFHLKSGIRYQDGSPLTAADVVYSIERSFSPALPNGPTYQKQFFLGGRTYRGPYSKGPAFRAADAPDDATVVIHLARRFPDMPYFAAFPMFTGVPQAKDDPRDPTAYGRHPMSTGPYQVQSFDATKALVLTKNPYWTADNDPARHQYADKWVFAFDNDPNVVDQRMIEDRGADRTALTQMMDGPTYQTLASKPDGKARVVTGSNPCTNLVYIDTRKVTDVRVRKAIGLAYPYYPVWKVFGSIPGVTVEPATSLLPNGMPGRESYDALGNGSIGNGDPAAAHALLVQANAVGFQLTWPYVSDFPQSVDAAHVQQQALQKAGFKVKLVPYTMDTAFAAMQNPTLPLSVRFSSWCSDWPSGSSWFPPLFYGPLIKQNPKAAPNMSFLDVPEVNQEIDRIESMTDLTQAAQAWGRLDRLVMTKYYPAVVTSATRSAAIRGAGIGGVGIDTTTGVVYYPDVYVNQ